MRVVLQRVTSASVSVDGEVVGAIGPGLVALVGIGPGDTADDAAALARKAVMMRIFQRPADTAHVSLLDIGGEVLVISQFTLLADTRKGHRPSWSGAAAPEVAEPLVDRFADACRDAGAQVATGRFGAHMVVELANDGPVTVVLERMRRVRAMGVRKCYALCMTTQLAIRISDELATSVDRLVSQGVFESRSDAVRAGLTLVVDEAARAAVGAAIVEGYRRFPQEDDELDWPEAATDAMIAAEPW